MAAATNPQLLIDIRYYGARADSEGKFPPHVWLGDIDQVYPLSGHVHAAGQRIARWLFSQGFRLGPRSHLCLHFTPDLAPGKIIDAGKGLEAWMHIVFFGMPLPKKPPDEAASCALVERATFHALKILRPEEHALLDAAQAQIAEHGERLRIPRLLKETRGHRIRVSFTVPRWKERAFLHVSVRDNNSGITQELKPLALRRFEDALFLADRVAVKDRVITVHPRKSSAAAIHVEKYKPPLTFKF